MRKIFGLLLGSALLLTLFQNFSSTYETPEKYGAIGNGKADDTAAMQKALNSKNSFNVPNVVYLSPKKQYRITSRLNVSANSGIVSDGSAVIIMGAKDGEFDNIDNSNRTGTHVVGLYVDHADNIILSGFKILKEFRDPSRAKAIYIRSSKNPLVEKIDASGFSGSGGVITIATVSNGIFRSNYIHDCFTDAIDASSSNHAYNQITGIEIDNDIVGGVPSRDLLISKNRIHNLTVGPKFNAQYGYQTDGINTVGGGKSQRITIEDNVIDGVGEGIDHFGIDSIIQRNTISNTALFGIKLIHCAQRNLVQNNTVSFSGLAGITVAGDDNCVTSDNTILSNRISDIASKGILGLDVYAGDPENTSAIMVASYGAAIGPQRTAVKNNIVTNGSQMAFGFHCRWAKETLFDGNVTFDWKLGYGQMPGCDNSNMILRTVETLKDVAFVPEGSETRLPFGRELVDSANEYETSDYGFLVKQTRTLQVSISARTNTLRVGKSFRLRIYKNYIAVADSTQTQTQNIGDFQAILSARVAVVAGDVITATLWQNDNNPVLLTPATENLNYFRVVSEL